jgi:hypothetical protein
MVSKTYKKTNKINSKHNKTKKINKNKKYIYNQSDFNSKNGFLTSVWGPLLWQYLHIMSFNYPVKPSISDKKHYKNFIINLKYVLPCKYCRDNLKNNFKKLPLLSKHMKNRFTFSKYIYELHELINKMLCKKSSLSYEDVRERYQHLRANCVLPKSFKNTTKKEKGCNKPLYGTKSKCIIKIVPSTNKTQTFEMDKNCIKEK